MMTEDELRDKFTGKRILFVDDKLLAVLVRKERLEELGVKVEIAENLAEAVELFESARKNKQPAPFELVVIDLYIPPVPPRLRRYEKELGEINLNHGQTLGLYLHDRFPNEVDYVYLTIVSEAFDDSLESQRNIRVFGKEDGLSPKIFPEELIEVLAW